jgi:tetratricopeptide (TPR) repeat protein
LLWAYVQKDHPDAVPILEAMSKGYLITFRLVPALECLDTWLKRRPDDIQALLLRGQTLDKLQRHENAIADYQRIIDLDPQNSEAREKLGRALTQAKQFAQAKEQFEWLRQKKPHDPAVLLGLARCYRALAQDDQAAPLLDALLTDQPNHVDALVERGKLHLDALQLKEAETCFVHAVQESPYEREAVYNLVLCLGKLKKNTEFQKWKGRLDHIEAELKRLADITSKIKQNPGDAGLRCEAGKIFLANGNSKEGLRWLHSALDEDPDHPETHKVLRDYYRRSGQLDLAAVHEQALAKPPVKAPGSSP